MNSKITNLECSEDLANYPPLRSIMEMYASRDLTDHASHQRRYFHWTKDLPSRWK